MGALRDNPSMHWLKRKRLKDEQIQRSLQKVR
jgi:hypothetical protein